MTLLFCPGHRYHKYRTGHEERKLQHLRKITQRLVVIRQLEEVTPEVEAEETPYSADWEGKLSHIPDS